MTMSATATVRRLVPRVRVIVNFVASFLEYTLRKYVTSVTDGRTHAQTDMIHINVLIRMSPDKYMYMNTYYFVPHSWL